MNKLRLVDKDTKNRCRENDVDAIRETLDILMANGLLKLRSCKEDHRFHQGCLQSLEELRDLITQP